MSTREKKFMHAQKVGYRSADDRNVLNNIMGTISSIINHGKSANIQVTNDSEMTSMDILLPYGIASSGFKGMMAQIMRNGTNDVIIGVYDTKRPNVGVGELVLYTRDGTQVKLDNNGNVDIICSGKVTIHGDLNVTGNINCNGNIRGTFTQS